VNVRWSLRRLDQLSPAELHDLLRLRQDVFIVEQDCAFHEIDGRDPQAWHLLGVDETGRLIAAARIFEPGALTEEAVIGRVVVALPARGSGLGRRLMQEAMRRVDELAPNAPMRVAAQQHLEDFYASLGFRTVGKSYVEDGILHVDMVRP